MRITLFLFALMLSFASCQDASQTAKDNAEKAANEAAKAVTDAVKKYKLSPFPASPAYTDAKMTNMKYAVGRFKFGVEGEGYKLGAQTPDAQQKNCANSAKGQHIHLIVDNEPYAAKYEAEFDYDLADGEHYILAFLSRSYHESIKTKEASRVRKVKVVNKAIKEESVVGEPMVFYSRPKGTYTGKANTDKVMLDFFLHNVTLGENFKVKADINGEIHMIDTWQPYYIEGLPMGENSITLTLVGKNGDPVNAPLNPVTRKFTLEVDQAEVSQ